MGYLSDATDTVTSAIKDPVKAVKDYYGGAAKTLKDLDGTTAANAKAAEAKAAQEAALSTFQNLQTPNIGKVALSKASYAKVGNTAYGNIQANAQDSAATQAAMSGYDDVINNGGLTAADKANIAQDRTANSTADRGRREAILQNAQAQGMAGGGNQLLAQLSSSQAATNANNQNDLTVQGQAQQNALSAIQNKGTLAANDQAAQYAQQNQVASAKDSLSQFNASNTLANNQYNNNIANNQTMQNSVYTPQQNYANSLAKAQGIAGQQVNLSNFNQNQANQQNIQNGQIAGGFAQIGAAAASDERVKKDIKPMKDSEIDEFLNAVQPKKFKYKDPSTPLTAPGQRDGFIAQDVANTKLGQDVVKPTEDGTLAFDKDNLQGVMLAALAKMHKEKK